MHPSSTPPELGEFAAFKWTITDLCRDLRLLFSGAGADAGATWQGPIRVGTDVSFSYNQSDRLSRVAPDIHVIEGMDDREQLRSYRTWERGGISPRLAIHLVDGPMAPEDGLLMHFFRLGLGEVVLYDPLWHLQPASPSGRRLLWHFVRGEQRLELAPQEHPGRIHIRRYGLWLVHHGGACLRVYGARGDEVPGEELRCSAG